MTEASSCSPHTAAIISGLWQVLVWGPHNSNEHKSRQNMLEVPGILICIVLSKIDGLSHLTISFSLHIFVPVYILT